MEGSLEKLIALVVAIPVGAMLINFFLSHSLIGYGYRLFVAPGVIIHEMAHAAGCLLTGAKITAFNVFDKKGGHVEHQKSKFGFVGQIIISLAPLLAGAAAIYFLTKLVGFKQVDLIGLPLTPEGIKNAVLHLVSNIDISSRRNWLLVYLLISVAVTMNPSRQDIKNITVSLLLIAGASFLVWRQFSPQFDILAHIPSQLIMIIGTIDLLLLLILVFSIIIFAISKLIKPI